MEDCLIYSKISDPPRRTPQDEAGRQRSGRKEGKATKRRRSNAHLKNTHNAGARRQLENDPRVQQTEILMQK